MDHCQKVKNEKVIRLMKDESGGQIIKECFELRAKKCSFLKENNDKDKKPKSTKNCIIKRKLKSQNNEKCLEAPQDDDKITNYLKK